MDSSYVIARLVAIEEHLNRESREIEEGLEHGAPTELRGAVRAGRVAGLQRGRVLIEALRRDLALQAARDARR